MLPGKTELDCALKIGLLLSLSGPWKAGRTIPGAAALAVQRINADPSLLGGMRVEYVYVDAGFTVSSGNDAMSKLLAMKGLDAIFGPGEPTVCGFVPLRLPACAVVGRPIDGYRMLCSIRRGVRVDGAAQRLFLVALPGSHNGLVVCRGWCQSSKTCSSRHMRARHRCCRTLGCTLRCAALCSCVLALLYPDRRHRSMMVRRCMMRALCSLCGPFRPRHRTRLLPWL
jgi:hypothetical protein